MRAILTVAGTLLLGLVALAAAYGTWLLSTADTDDDGARGAVGLLLVGGAVAGAIAGVTALGVARRLGRPLH